MEPENKQVNLSEFPDHIGQECQDLVMLMKDLIGPLICEKNSHVVLNSFIILFSDFVALCLEFKKEEAERSLSVILDSVSKNVIKFCEWHKKIENINDI